VVVAGTVVVVTGSVVVVREVAGRSTQSPVATSHTRP
jgi:hypothetical protein